MGETAAVFLNECSKFPITGMVTGQHSIPQIIPVSTTGPLSATKQYRVIIASHGQAVSGLTRPSDHRTNRQRDRRAGTELGCGRDIGTTTADRLLNRQQGSVVISRTAGTTGPYYGCTATSSPAPGLLGED